MPKRSDTTFRQAIGAIAPSPRGGEGWGEGVLSPSVPSNLGTPSPNPLPAGERALSRSAS
jgi:hypothetical protein